MGMRNKGDKPILIWPEWGHKMAVKEGYTDFLDPTAWVVSGGGGGVTSEHVPKADGTDDQYGFMDMTLSKESLKIEAISHGGQLRRTIVIEHNYAHGKTTRAQPREMKEVTATQLANRTSFTVPGFMEE